MIKKNAGAVHWVVGANPSLRTQWRVYCEDDIYPSRYTIIFLISHPLMPSYLFHLLILNKVFSIVFAMPWHTVCPWPNCP